MSRASKAARKREQARNHAYALRFAISDEEIENDARGLISYILTIPESDRAAKYESSQRYARNGRRTQDGHYNFMPSVAALCRLAKHYWPDRPPQQTAAEGESGAQVEAENASAETPGTPMARRFRGNLRGIAHSVARAAARCPT